MSVASYHLPQGSCKLVAKSPMAMIDVIWLQEIGNGDISGDRGNSRINLF